jgi:hypothetical protein
MSEDRETPNPAQELLDRDWAGDILSHVDKIVDGVQDKAVVPLVTIARAIVFGIIIAVMVCASAVLLSLTIVRAMDNYVSNGRVWISYLIVGGLFLVVGLLLWALRKTKEA